MLPEPAIFAGPSIALPHAALLPRSGPNPTLIHWVRSRPRRNAHATKASTE